MFPVTQDRRRKTVSSGCEDHGQQSRLLFPKDPFPQQFLCCRRLIRPDFLSFYVRNLPLHSRHGQAEDRHEGSRDQLRVSNRLWTHLQLPDPAVRKVKDG